MMHGERRDGQEEDLHRGDERARIVRRTGTVLLRPWFARGCVFRPACFCFVCCERG